MHGWTSRQRNAAIASFLSWTLDAFDFFLLVFLLSDIAHSFHVDLEEVTLAILLTLAVRPVGALIFGRAAEKFGRKPILMLNIVFFSAFELLSAAAPSLMLFFLLRVLYGVAMGGIWGVASSLAMETIPDRSRGLMSGLFQAGYPFGYLLAAVAYGLLFEQLGWRGMFVIGAAPVLLLPFIYFCVEESPVWQAARQNKESTALLPVLRSHWKLCLYLVVLMAAFNFFSHGTQDLYPVFLKVQHGFEPKTVSIIAVCYNIASIISVLRFAVGENWPAQSDYDCRSAGAAGYPAVGLRQRLAGAGGWGISDAIYGARRLGGDPDLAQRTGAGQHPGGAARLRLSAGQSAGFGERHAAGINRPASWA